MFLCMCHCVGIEVDNMDWRTIFHILHNKKDQWIVLLISGLTFYFFNIIKMFLVILAHRYIFTLSKN